MTIRVGINGFGRIGRNFWRAVHAAQAAGPGGQARDIEIVRKEKQVADDKLTQDTPLADAGIDSLDSLTILFAIEETFHISIPDDKARAIKTFGDMVDVVVSLTNAE